METKFYTVELFFFFHYIFPMNTQENSLLFSVMLSYSSISRLTLEIPVYEPQFRGSARFVEVRDFSRWEVFFLVPKHIKMVQNT